MTTFDRDPLFDPRISDWLEADPDRAPEVVLETVTAAFPSIPQRHAWRAPWRFPTMPMPARAAGLVALGALVIAGALAIVGSGGRSGPAPTTQPTAATIPSAASSSVATTSPSTAPAALDLSGTFSSPRYGYTISAAPDWIITPATLTWSGPDNTAPVVDDITFAGGGGITGASEALLPGQTWAQWLNQFQPPNLTGGCSGDAPDTWPSIQIGDQAGAWQAMCGGSGEAIVQRGDRAYVFAFSPGSVDGAITFDQLKQILTTVRFDPTAVPSPLPPPTLAKTFTSTRYGYSLSYPSGFTASPATKDVNGVLIPDPTGSSVDVISNETARLVVWSAALAPGQTADAWVKTYCQARRTQWTQPCEGAPGNWREIPLASGTAHLMVDGDSAGTYVRGESRLFVVTAASGNRAYSILMDGDLNEDLFLAVLKSMRLDPAAATP